jgi:predicted GTPase
VESGIVVFAGVDYGAVLTEAEHEADVILWDGGNNDWPFYRPNLWITVADPLRPGHEVGYYPGETNVRMAHAVVINKVDSAAPEGVATVRTHVRELNPRATIIEAASPIVADDMAAIAGRRVLVVEDGPTLTHGEMAFGAGTVAARKFGASEIVDPRPFAVGKLVDTYRTYPGIGVLLPAMGYGDEQVRDLEATINRVPCDTVVIGTPIDLTRLVRIEKPTVRVRYDLQEIGRPTLEDVMAPLIERARRTAPAIPR